MDTMVLIFGIIIGLVIGILIMRVIAFREMREHSRQAVRNSKNSIMGEVYEKILPAMPHFPYAPKDMVFIGKGCDYVIFDGLDRGTLREIVFLELKSGKSRLNQHEKMIRSALDAKRVRFAEYRIDSIKE